MSPAEVRPVADRLPPNQRLVTNWPVLHYGSVPRIDLDQWSLRVFGLVEQPLHLTWEALSSLPQHRVETDIHCVTGWSRFDNVFEGPRVMDVLAEAGVRPEGRFAMIHAEHGFTTNVPLADLMRPDVILAHSHGGRPLTPEHGWPLRLLVPHLYFWKSAKWVRGIELVSEDRPGFWEEAGYHMRGDPWREERFRDDF